jgi:hypothetical protein
MILAGWDVNNDGAGVAPFETVFPYSEVDFDLFIQDIVYYEGRAAMLTTASAAILAMIAY